jgi:Ca2+-binding EF-hand superfamily protein
MLIKMADSKIIEDLRKEFEKIDKDGSGMLTADEL